MHNFWGGGGGGKLKIKIFLSPLPSQSKTLLIFLSTGDAHSHRNDVNYANYLHPYYNDSTPHVMLLWLLLDGYGCVCVCSQRMVMVLCVCVCVLSKYKKVPTESD